MNSKEQEQEKINFESDRVKSSSDYKILVQKLRSIKKTISLLEKHSLEKET